MTSRRPPSPETAVTVSNRPDGKERVEVASFDGYEVFVAEPKAHIASARVSVARRVNSELVNLDSDIGVAIAESNPATAGVTPLLRALHATFRPPSPPLPAEFRGKLPTARQLSAVPAAQTTPATNPFEFHGINNSWKLATDEPQVLLLADVLVKHRPSPPTPRPRRASHPPANPHPHVSPGSISGHRTAYSDETNFALAAISNQS